MHQSVHSPVLRSTPAGLSATLSIDSAAAGAHDDLDARLASWTERCDVAGLRASYEAQNELVYATDFVPRALVRELHHAVAVGQARREELGRRDDLRAKGRQYGDHGDRLRAGCRRGDGGREGARAPRPFAERVRAAARGVRGLRLRWSGICHFPEAKGRRLSRSHGSIVRKPGATGDP